MNSQIKFKSQLFAVIRKPAFFVLLLLLALSVSACGKSSNDNTGSQNSDGTGIVKKYSTPAPTATPTPTPTPTPSPTPTPTPIPGWDYDFVPISEDSPVSVASLDLSNNANKYFDSTPIKNGDDCYFMFGNDYNSIIYQINTETGKFEEYCTIPIDFWSVANPDVLDDGSVICYEYEHYGHSIFDREGNITSSFYDDEFTKLFRKDGTGYYYTDNSDYEETKLFFHSLETGEDTDLSYVMQRDYLSKSYYMDSLIFDDRVLVFSSYSNGTTTYIFVSVAEPVLWDTINAEDIHFDTTSDSFLIYYKHVAYPELLFGDEALRSNIKGIDYTSDDECSNASRFENYIFTEYVDDYVNGKPERFFENNYEDEELYNVRRVLSCYNTEDGSLTQTVVLTDKNHYVYYKPFYCDSENCLAYGFVTDSDNYKYGIYKWDFSDSKNIVCNDKSYVFDYSDDEDPSLEAIAEIRDEALRLSEKYDIVVRTGNDILGVYDQYFCGPEFNMRLLKKTLSQLDEILGKYPEGFFTKLAEDIYPDKLKFDLVESFSWNGEGEGVSNAIALYCPSIDGHCIVVDCNYYYGFDQNIYHELTHAADNYLYSNYGDYYDALDDFWYDYNPEYFVYDWSYVDNSENNDYSWTYYEEEYPENVYFIDNYSKSYPTEDRARVMEYYLQNGPSYVEDYPHLKAKVEFLQSAYEEVFGEKFKFND